MIKNKIVVVAMAGMLAMCVGLTACGGNNASSSAASRSASASAASSASASASAASSASASASGSASASAASSTASSAADITIAYWEGTLPDGSIVDYADDQASGIAALSVAKSDYSDATAWFGPASVAGDGAVTITDAETNHTIKFNIVDATNESIKIDIEGYGEVELKPVTEAEFEAQVEQFKQTPEGKKLFKKIKLESKKLKKAAAKQAKKLQNEFNKLDGSTVLFWDGKLDDNLSVSYMDNPDGKEAFFTVYKPDYSQGAVWYGTYTTDAEGKVTTLTDSETNQTIAYEIVESTPEASKMNIQGFGEIELKPVTKDDFVKYVEELQKLEQASAAK